MRECQVTVEVVGHCTVWNQRRLNRLSLEVQKEAEARVDQRPTVVGVTFKISRH